MTTTSEESHQAERHESAQDDAREISRENLATHPVVEHLQRQVANAFVLYMNYKHYHWQTFGPLFRDLHKLFDDLAEEVLETIDTFAERLRMIGQDPVAGPLAVVRTASVQIAEEDQNVREMVVEADENLLGVIREMREAVRAADASDDPGTTDVLTRAVQVHEKHEWFLRQVLEQDDGLVS